MINLSQKQSDAWHYLEDDTTTEVLYGGGAFGGKSYLMCIWHITRRMTYPESRGLIGRAKIANLEQSTLVTLFKVAGEMGYKQGVHFNYNSQKHTINWNNGSQTILKDLFLYPSDPDFISLGSTEFTDACIDEATEITEKAFDIINSRIRWNLDKYGLIPKVLMTCNPSSGWIKDKYISSKGQPVRLKSDQVFIKALATDNPDIEMQKLVISQLQKLSEYDKARLLHGDWEVDRNILNPFANQYDSKLHESTDVCMYQGRQTYLSIDFNLNPFALNVYQAWQDDRGFHCHQVDEASIEKGSIPAMIELIKTKYAVYLPTLKLTGDYSGTAGQLSQVDNASFYDQLQRGLKLRDNQVVLVPNPKHTNSRADCNYFLANFPDFKINPIKCPDSCRDMRVVQCDAFGQIIKKVRSDLTQQADHIDGFRYFINTFMLDWINKHQKGWYNLKKTA